MSATVCSILPRHVGLVLLIFGVLGTEGRAQPIEFTGNVLGSHSSLLLFQQNWKFISGVSATVTYDDNIFITPNHERPDFLLQIRPSVALGLGDFWNQLNLFREQTDVNSILVADRDEPKKNYAFVSYSPTVDIFARTRHSDTFDQDITFAAFQGHARTDVREQLQYQTDTAPNSEVGGRVKSTRYIGLVNASYVPSEKTEIDGALSVSWNRYSSGIGSKEAETTAAMGYRAAPKTMLGGEVTVGYVRPDAGSEQSFIRPAVTLSYAPKEKLSFSGFVGEALRRIGGDRAIRGTFTFDSVAAYEIKPNQAINIQAQREVRTSALYVGEDLVVTTYQIEFKQSLLQSCYFTISAGRSSESLEQNNQDVSRSDKLYFGRFAVSRKTGRQSRIEFSYLYNRNLSSDPTFGFLRNNVGFNYIYVF